MVQSITPGFYIDETLLPLPASIQKLVSRPCSRHRWYCCWASCKHSFWRSSKQSRREWRNWQSV